MHKSKHVRLHALLALLLVIGVGSVGFHLGFWF